MSTPASLAAAGHQLVLELTRRYTEPHRRYHDIRHIAQMLAWGMEVGLDDAQVWAIWFHDAVYDPRRPDNEEQSAVLAERCLLASGHGQDLVNVVTQIVRDTRTHTPTVRESGLVLDLDLGTLALPWDAFCNNTAAIRGEYAHVDDASFATGRRRFMAGLLERPRLFFTPWGEKREATARANITRFLNDSGAD
ncbi:MAG: hypothetical protein R3F56_22310 [Planctomycetota bacterium]